MGTERLHISLVNKSANQMTFTVDFCSTYFITIMHVMLNLHKLRSKTAHDLSLSIITIRLSLTLVDT